MATTEPAEPGTGRPPSDTGVPDTPTAGVAAVDHHSRRRNRWINALIVFTAVLSLVGMLSVWANRLLFNPDNWESTSTQLLQNKDIRSATSNYLVDQLYTNVNVPNLIRSGLPPQLQGLAAPAAGALQNVAVQGVDLLLTRPRVQNLWARANRAAAQTFIAIAEGGKGAVKVNGGVVTLDLGAVLDTVAARLGLPSDLSSKLPPSVAHLTILKSDQLKYIQTGGRLIRHLALWLTILVPLLYLLAIYLARDRRRNALMKVGVALALAGVLGIAGRHILQTQVANALTSDASLRPAILATIGIGTQILAQIASAFILVGLVVIAAAWFAGPAHAAVTMRRAITPFMREHPTETFAITTAIMVLIFIWNPIPATGTIGGIVSFLVLALVGTAALRRQALAEFPEARPGETTAALRTRVHSWRDGRASKTAHARPDTLTEQLERLTRLRDTGAITADEYSAAKGRLLSP